MNLAHPIRVALIDDHLLLLEAVAARLRLASDIQVVSSCTDAEEGLQQVLELHPHVVLLDLELPGRGSFEIAQAITSRPAAPRILFMTGHLSDIFIEQAIRIRAHGYLMKGEPVEKLLEAIRTVAKGEYFFSAAVRDRLEFDPRRRQYTLHASSPLSTLTGRQIEVLRHLARGQSVKEIAKSLHLSQKSVDSHKYRIMNKLDIHDRVQLARYAIREGLSMP